MTEAPGPPPAPEPMPSEGPEAASPAEPAATNEAAPTTEPPTTDEPATDAEPVVPPSAASLPPAPGPTVESTRRLLGASFDLLLRSSDDMRRASFYIGAIVLVTVGPFALASWAEEIVSIHQTARHMEIVFASSGSVWYGGLGIVAGFGLIVAAVESRAMAAGVLGGQLARRPITVRQALARSRMVFWRVIVASIIVGIPVLVAQTALTLVFESAFGPQTDLSIVASTLAAAIVGSPLAYLLTGVVLGDVEPFEAARRSVRVFRARKMAAALVAVFETTALLLVLFGLSAGLDVALRVFDALGLSAESGPAGLLLVTIGVIAGVFALGTLIYTALAISIAPQVVMFVGLTQATFGLDHVRPSGDRDPGGPLRPGARRFRWLTLPMLMAVVVGGLGLAAFVRVLTG